MASNRPTGFTVRKSSLKASELRLELVFLVFSFLVYIADMLTDVILGVQYLNLGHLDWGLLTILLCFLPLVVCQFISLRWHQVDSSKLGLFQIVIHLLFLGIIQRYFYLLKVIFNLLRKNLNPQTKKHSFMLYNHYQNDISMLRLFESFLESAPQLLLQLYIMYEMDYWYPWTVFCAIGSLVSLAVGVASYTRTMRLAHEDKGDITWRGFVLQALWRTGTIVSRLFALLLCATVFHLWFVLALMVHWVFMTLWIIKQRTDFCVTRWEEYVYNGINGVIYCFCFFNLKEGMSRKRMFTFYLVIAFENALCLFLFFAFPGNVRNNRYEWFPTTATALIVCGTIMGHTSQLLYYRWFHPSGSIGVPSCATALYRVESKLSQLSSLESNYKSTFTKTFDLSQSSHGTGTSFAINHAGQTRECLNLQAVNICNEISQFKRKRKRMHHRILTPQNKLLVRSFSDSELMYRSKISHRILGASEWHSASCNQYTTPDVDSKKPIIQPEYLKE